MKHENFYIINKYWSVFKQGLGIQILLLKLSLHHIQNESREQTLMGLKESGCAMWEVFCLRLIYNTKQKETEET